MDYNQSIDYMAYRDSFAVHAGIASTLVCGDRNLCPKPFLSIVVPTYRRPDFLKLALDSALKQVKPGVSYEVVVVDNEAPGEGPSQTEALIRQYDAPHLFYYRNGENLGIAGNWNRCAELARGTWVAYLHDDDLLAADYVRKMVGLISKRKNAGGIMALAFELRSEAGLEEAESTPRSRSSLIYDRLSANKLMRLRRTDSHFLISNAYGAPSCGSAFRRDLLMASGGFDERFHPSFDWFLLYRFGGMHKLYRSMERLGHYRVLVNVSLSDKTKEAFLRDRLSFVEYADRHTRLGHMLRSLFKNEQNNAILHEEYTDYQGKTAQAHFEAAAIKERPMRTRLYRLITKGYWRIKSNFCLIFG